MEHQIHNKLIEELRALNGVKLQLALKVRLRKENPDGNEEYTGPVLRKSRRLSFKRTRYKIQETLEKWTQRGSGWVVDGVWLDIAGYQPLRGGNYIPLPVALRNKKADINVKNWDDNCLRWALGSALFPVVKDPQRPTKYPNKDGLDVTGIDTPTPISQIPKVER